MALSDEDRVKFEKYHAQWLAEVDPNGEDRRRWPADYGLVLEDPWTVSNDGVTIDFYQVGEDSWWAIGRSGEVVFGDTLENAVDAAWDPTTAEERAAMAAAAKVRDEWFSISVLLGRWDSSYAKAGYERPSVYQRDPEHRAYTGAELIEIADRMAAGGMN